MSRDRRGNGIQEVDGSIPFGSTNTNPTIPQHLTSPALLTQNRSANRSRLVARLVTLRRF